MQTSPVTAAPGRPLLKWAGGKRQLLPALAALSTRHSSTATSRRSWAAARCSSTCWPQGRLAGTPVTLADVNPDLIGCYRTLRDHTDSGDCGARGARDRAPVARRGLLLRRARPPVQPGARRAVLARAPRGASGSAASYPPDLAAMLIFLNRTGFNGLFRLNRSGGFNVPAGRYAEPRICDPAHLRTVADAFRAPGVTLELSGFEAVLADAGAGDFVYCDPPYAPLSRTASFANYTADGFTAEDQARLCAAVVDARARAAPSSCCRIPARDEIVDLYSSERARAGRAVPAPRPCAPDDQLARHGARAGRRADRHQQPAVAGRRAVTDAAGSAGSPSQDGVKPGKACAPALSRAESGVRCKGRESGGTGRRARLRIWYPKGCVGSSPSFRTSAFHQQASCLSPEP